MENTSIPWYASRTIWASLISAAAGILAVTGHAVDPALMQGIPDLIVSAISTVSGVIGIYGRIAATKTIG